jgi:hypothetical protein
MIEVKELREGTVQVVVDFLDVSVMEQARLVMLVLLKAGNVVILAHRERSGA